MSDVLSAPLQRRTLDPVAEVDRLVFTDYGREPALQDDPAVRLSLIRESVAHHIGSCRAYADFSHKLGFVLDALQEPVDLDRVPQLPAGVFKRATVRSIVDDDVAKRCTSSGTRGTVSVIHRDRPTIERLLGSVRLGIGLLGEWYEDDTAVLNLGPSSDEAGDLWFSYIMSLVELVHRTRHAVKGGVFDPRNALQELESLAASVPAPVLIGPPALVLRLAEAAREHRSFAIEALTVVTAGGWKRARVEEVDRDRLTCAVMEAFGIDDAGRIRDAFNQVELNTVMMECASHRKHVPPWLHVIVRSLHNLEPLACGEQGVLSYLDPTAASYPCFLLSDDVGVLDTGPCDCGWPGRTLSIERRLTRSESWGCALKMDRAWGAADR